MNLYDIDQKMKEAFEKAVDPETGEILDEGALNDFYALDMARDEKIDNILCFIKDLKSDAKAIKAEEDSLAKRRRSADRKAEWLTRYVKNILAGQKFKSARAEASYMKSASVNITDMSLIPSQFLKYADPTPDKVAIKESIKDGVDVPGAEVVENNNLIIK